MPVENNWIFQQRIPCVVKKRARASNMLRPTVMKRTQSMPCLGFPPHLNQRGSEFPPHVAFPNCLTSLLSFSAVLKKVVIPLPRGSTFLFSIMEGRAQWEREFERGVDPDGNNTSWFHELLPSSSQNSLSFEQIFKRTANKRSCLNPFCISCCWFSR